MATAGAIGWLNRERFGLTGRQASPAVPSVATPRRQVPPGHLPVLRFQELLDAAGAAGLVREIQDKANFTPANFDKDLLPVLQEICEFVQMLPASESHHHAQPGGLILHLLEVTRNALHFREGLKLPEGTSPEDQSRLAARWTYGVFLGALLHDIGKPIADLSVGLFDEMGQRVRSWNGMAGSMVAAGAASYTVDFPEAREYGLHQKLPVILFRSLVPVATLQWLSEDEQLLQVLMSYLAGDNREHVLAKTVAKADRMSVAQNLLSGPRTRFASARAVPVIERLMSGLRRMLEEGGHLPLNRPGAAGFVSGDSVWFVAGTVADRVRTYLNGNEVRREGAAGLPEDNSKVFDIWQEYGAVVSNASGGAMWRIEVEIGEWRERFTVLRFPLSKLYRTSDLYPAPCAGLVTSVDPNAAAPVLADEGAQPSSNDPAEPGASPKTAAPQLVAATSGTAPSSGPTPVPQLPVDDATPAPAAAETELVSPNGPEPVEGAVAPIEVRSDRRQVPVEPMPSDKFLDDADSAVSEVAPAPSSVVPPERPTAPMAPKEKRRGREVDAIVSAESPAASRFFAWLQAGLADGSIKYNQTAAQVHFVEEGMLLVTPRILQEYAKMYGPEGDGNGTSVPNGWKQLQQAVQRSGRIRRNPETAGTSFIFIYSVTIAPQDDAQAKPINCFLMPKPEQLLNPVPSPNPFFRSKAARLAELDEAAKGSRRVAAGGA